MAGTPGVKSRGMTFAEKQLQRHGWTEGKGLGKRESGISEALKVKVKCDTAGVGHNSAEQFTFHWWDHVFNKTASSISVEPDQDGVQVKKVTDDESAVTNKRPRKALAHRDMLYGRFIKSATLLSEGEKPVAKESSSDSSEDEDEKLNLSSATKLTDADLMKICGGRTAHKGARHGLTMSAKLLRIEEQERAFLEKYGKTDPSKEPLRPMRGLALEEEAETESMLEKRSKEITKEDFSSNTRQRKKKKKRAKEEKTLGEDRANGYEEHVPWKEDDDSRQSRGNEDNTELIDDLSGVASSSKTVDEDMARGLNHGHLKYLKKKKKVREEADLEYHAGSIENKSSKKEKRKVDEKDEVGEELLNGHKEWAPSGDPRPSKKKKSSKRGLEENVEEQEESTEEYVQSAKKKKKPKKVEEVDEHVSMENEECQTKKKRKKSKNKYRDCSAPEEELEQVVNNTDYSVKKKKAERVVCIE